MAVIKDSSLSIVLVERDSSGDDLCVWTYPGASPAIQNVCVNRSSIEGQQQGFIYFKLRQDWIYAYTHIMAKDVAPDVISATVCVVSKTFNPDVYETLTKIFHEQYRTTGDPTKILEGYLSLYTLGSFSNPMGSVDLAACKTPQKDLALSCMRSLHDMLGVEFIVLWNAMLLKKRVLVVGDSIASLLETIQTLSQLIWHRKEEAASIMRPLVRIDSTDEHVEDLTSAGVFTAGTLDASLAGKSELYDVLLSLPERRVTVTSHALAEMKMCSVHRELASTLQSMTEADPSVSDFEILKAVAKKTSVLLSQLRTLASSSANGKLTEAIINENVSQTAAQQWLVRLATAEGML